MAANKKLKILCLHGYRQHGYAFREKTGSFRKSLKKYADFVFIDAPHEVCAEQGGGMSHAPSLGWWFSREDNYYKAIEYSDIEQGFAESVGYILKFIKENGPFDGILAFSQGASFLSMLCAMKESKEISLDVSFVMLFAGFKSRCSPHRKYYSKDIKCSTKALLCIGEADEVIPLDMGNELIEHFQDPVVLHHPGGHFVPNQLDQRKAYSEFLEQQMSQS
ncbi:esterase CBG03338-like [Watersipora subatra]|uniref:esterase CBG03338-like n=1 Tax=Watersipora subatra TaxID=2589382 RepID=UPI00355C25C5